MMLKRYNKTASGASWFLLSLAVVLLLILATLVYRRGSFIGLDKKNSPTLVMQTQERAFEIIVKSENGYKARALDREEEANLILSEKNLKTKTIVVLKKYIKAANGLVAYEAQILPGVPTAKPTGRLPDKPE